MSPSLKLSFTVALVTALAGCASTPPRDVAPMAETPAPVVAEMTRVPPAEDSAPQDGAIDVEGGQTASSIANRAKLEPGTGNFINREAASRQPSGGQTGDVTFNFENAPIQTVIKSILGDLLQENYVIAPGVQGNVTFATSKPINASQARTVLETLLAWNNLAVVYKEGRYTVLPIGQAVPGNLTPRLGPASTARGYEVRVVPLQFIAPTELEKVLAPYVKQGAIIKADNARSMIVIAGNASELQSYLETIEIFDVDWLAGMSVGMFPLERIEAKDVVPELEKIFGDGGATPLAGMFRFLPIERMNAVLVITPQPRYLEQAQRWLERLDRGGAEAGAQLYVYYVKNVKATDLSDNLTEIFTGSKSSDSSRKSSIAGVAPGLAPVEIRTVGEGQKEGNDRPAPPAGGGIAITQSDDIRISAIEESNSLLIRATPVEYEAILSAIKRLDVVPLQVHIEAKILSVTLSDNLSLGVEWYFENNASSDITRAVRNRPNRVNSDGTPTGRNAWDSYAGRLGSGGLSWTFLNTSAEALLSTLQSNGNAKVLSAPSLVVLNNKEASINVGTQLPVVSSFINGVSNGVGNETGGTGNLNSGIGQSYVQFRNTGITLNVTPRVNPGGLVFMEVTQEDSQPLSADTAVAGNVAVSQRQIKTEIAVQSGQTVLLGGLIRDKDSIDESGLPGLSRIPVIGGLFGRTAKSKEREELLVLITPTVIDNAASAQDVTNAYREQFKGLRPIFEKLDEIQVRLPQAEGNQP